MTKIYTPADTAEFLKLAQDAELSNNGRTFLCAMPAAAVVEMLEAAGYRVTLGHNAFGAPSVIVWTAKGWACAVEAHNKACRALADRFNAAQFRRL